MWNNKSWPHKNLKRLILSGNARLITFETCFITVKRTLFKSLCKRTTFLRNKMFMQQKKKIESMKSHQCERTVIGLSNFNVRSVWNVTFRIFVMLYKKPISADFFFVGYFFVGWLIKYGRWQHHFGQSPTQNWRPTLNVHPQWYFNIHSKHFFFLLAPFCQRPHTYL